MTPNTSINRIVRKRRSQTPSALRAPATCYLKS